MRFNLRGMDIKKALFACAPGQKDSIDDLNAFKADLAAFVDRAKESEALVHLACRYVRNIANGRFLWRNRTVASSATVEVLLPDGTKKMFDALATPFNHFEEVSDDERAVAEVLALSLIHILRLPSFSFFVNIRRFTCDSRLHLLNRLHGGQLLGAAGGVEAVLLNRLHGGQRDARRENPPRSF